MIYNVKIDIHTIPLTGLWCNTNEWCKAGDVAHLCSIMVTMYRALERLNNSDAIDNELRTAIRFAINRAHEVTP